MLFNSRSIVNKISELYFIIEKYHPKILLLTETWLNHNNHLISDFTFYSNYTPIFSNRKNKRGGGSLIMINNELSFEPIFNICEFNCEIVGIKLVADPKIMIICVYRPPNCSINNTINLFKYLSKFSSKNIIICGDFNLPKIEWNENDIKI